jgi:lambda family phage portal protein
MKLPFFNRRKSNPTGVRYFKAAEVGRLLSGMFGSSASPDSTIKPSLAKMRDRARDLERNNEYAARALDLVENGVVGERGFNLQVKGINLDGRLDVAGNDLIERNWHDWSRECTVDGMTTFRDFCSLAIRAVKRDGEFFCQVIKNSQYKHGIALNPMEADRVDIDKNEVLPGGRKIRMGVETNEFGKPVAYWVLNYHPGDYDYMAPRAEKKHTRVPAENMIHVFRRTRPGQTRGVTAFAPAIFSMQMLNGYREAEITAARAAAAKFGVLVSQDNEGLADSYDGDVPEMMADAGTVQVLPPGYDYKMIDPTHPTSAFADFHKSVLRGIASGLGLSYESLSNDLENTSYSSIRQGALLERDNFKNDQRFMIEHLVDKVFRLWLEWTLSTSQYGIRPDKLNKFSRDIQWRGRGFSWVDPKKEIEAAVIGLHNGILSMQDVANQYGRDVEETFAQIQRDKETAAQFGIETAFEPFGATKSQIEPLVEGDDDELQSD